MIHIVISAQRYSQDCTGWSGELAHARCVCGALNYTSAAEGPWPALSSAEPVVHYISSLFKHI